MTSEKLINFESSIRISPEDVQSSLENMSFIPALKAAYDLIIYIDVESDRVRFIHGRETTSIGPIYDVEMNFKTACDFWINNYIEPSSGESVRNYFMDIVNNVDRDVSGITFDLKWSDNNVHSMFIIDISVTSKLFLLCCQILKVSGGSALTIPSRGIFVRTFGHFDVFVEGKPVIFSSSKEKELLALLIDRNGGTLTSSDGISCLWDIEEPDEKIKARYRKLAMNLKNTLESYGISHILKNAHGTRCIDTTTLVCDYYELLKNNEMYRSSFHNTYMNGYKWNEATLSLLWDYS